MADSGLQKKGCASDQLSDTPKRRSRTDRTSQSILRGGGAHRTTLNHGFRWESRHSLQAFRTWRTCTPAAMT